MYGQIIDPNGKCLIWKCVPSQPSCCPRIRSPENIKCAADSDLGQIKDSQTGCLIWTCIPRQPHCCRKTFPIEKCPTTYNYQVYDIKTGCFILACTPCPRVDFLFQCFTGSPYQRIGANGCMEWACGPEFLPISLV